MASTRSSSTMAAPSTSLSFPCGPASMTSMSPATRIGASRASSSSKANSARFPLLLGLMALAMAILLLSLAPVQAAGTGMIFVSTEKGNEVVVLDQGLNVVKRIATSRRPRDMHFNADKTLLYVACGDDDAIDAIDVATLEVIDSIPTGPSPEVFRFPPARPEADLRVERGGQPARGHRHGDPRLDPGHRLRGRARGCAGDAGRQDGLCHLGSRRHGARGRHRRQAR